MTPASRTAKSAAVEVGNFCARYSSKSPVKPGSPGQRRPVAIARVTDVWNSRTRERSGVSSSTLTSMPAVLPVERAALDLDLDVGPLALAEVPTASAALFVRENSTLS